jgi:DNA-binding NtrC family response regulator
MKSRILMIDDEPRWIDFAKNDLHEFDIVIAPDPKTACAELENDQFDLIIAGSRHIDALESISMKFPENPLAIATIQPMRREAIVAYRFGALSYFAKSFGPGDLSRRVEDLLAIAKSRCGILRCSRKDCYDH